MNAGTSPAVRLAENMPTPVQVWAGIAQATLTPSLSSCFVSLQTLLNTVALLSCILPPHQLSETSTPTLALLDTFFSQNTPVKPETVIDNSDCD